MGTIRVRGSVKKIDRRRTIVEKVFELLKQTNTLLPGPHMGFGGAVGKSMERKEKKQRGEKIKENWKKRQKHKKENNEEKELKH